MGVGDTGGHHYHTVEDSHPVGGPRRAGSGGDVTVKGLFTGFARWIGKIFHPHKDKTPVPKLFSSRSLSPTAEGAVPALSPPLLMLKGVDSFAKRESQFA
ncbi:unnamed protein product [Tilletia controversa]|nr:unnamed protein product [Tilletia controversa]